MKILIPYKRPDNDISLKYSLRSLLKHLPYQFEPYDLIIVGDAPKGFTRFLHIAAADDPRATLREKNIADKLLLGCSEIAHNEETLYAHDDHFLKNDPTLKPSNTFPFYYSDQFSGNGTYKKTVTNTINATGQQRNYDIHLPKTILPATMISVLKEADWQKPWGYCIKTLYCAGNTEKPHTITTDNVIREPLSEAEISGRIRNRFFFSIKDEALNSAMITTLEKLYPEPTIFEL